MFDWDSLEKLSEEEKMEKFRQHLNDLKKKKAESYGPLGAYLFLQLQPEWEPRYNFAEEDPNENKLFDQEQMCLQAAHKFLVKMRETAWNCQFVKAVDEAISYYDELQQRVIEPLLKQGTGQEYEKWKIDMEQELYDFTGDFREICQEVIENSTWKDVRPKSVEEYQTLVKIERQDNGQCRYTGTSLAVEYMEKTVNEWLFTFFNSIKSQFKRYVEALAESAGELTLEEVGL